MKSYASTLALFARLTSFNSNYSHENVNLHLLMKSAQSSLNSITFYSLLVVPLLNHKAIGQCP